MESDHRPLLYKSSALTTELHAHAEHYIKHEHLFILHIIMIHDVQV